jgi:hypothetical protein
MEFFCSHLDENAHLYFQLNCLVLKFFLFPATCIFFYAVCAESTLLVTPPRLALYYTIGFDKYTRRQRSSFPSEEKAGHASPIAEFAFYFSLRARRRRFS